MDYREVQFWKREARKANLLREAQALIAGRMAMARDEDYSLRMTTLEWQLRLIDKEDD